MCGRFTLTVSPDEIAELLGLPDVPAVTPRYNIAPTQRVLAARLDPDGRREAVFLKWGLVPSWAADESIAFKLINARSETVAEKPSFRQAFRKRRCLVPADGFFEWRAEGRRKVPHRFKRPDGKPFFIAGLWERWERPGGEPLQTCSLLTTEANETVKPVHPRMPVILTQSAAARWLTPQPLLPADADELLTPVPAEFLVVQRVSDIVNSARIDDPRCIEPAGNETLF